MEKRFITPTKARRILGRDSKNMTDAQLNEALDSLYQLAELVYSEIQSDMTP